MDNKVIRNLIETAAAQRARSYAPYSHYRVGAALLAGDGTVFTGCNIENAAYAPSLCRRFHPAMLCPVVCAARS